MKKTRQAVTSKTASYEDDFPEFMAAVRARLSRGERLFGSKALNYSNGRLLHEIEEELVDVLGWSYWQWKRIRRIRQALSSISSPRGSRPS